ncbi:MAG: tetratricopeptide repeat protein, partial [Cyanobacteria bacterium P01_D01_bin.116]
MKIYRYIIVILLTFVLTISFTQVAAKHPISVNSSSITQIKQSNILETGKQFYDEGKLTQAAQIWEQAVIEFEKKEELGNQVLANNYLSVVYQDLGKWEFAQKSVNQALKLVKEVDDRLLYAQVLNTKGSLELKTGNAQIALDSWKQSEEIYRQLDDVTGIVLSQINQAQALQNLGFYRRGRVKLEQVAIELDKLPDSLIKARGLRSLGNILQAVGDSDNSQKFLLQSLNIAQKLNSKTDIAQALLILGNSAKVNDNISIAL